MPAMTAEMMPRDDSMHWLATIVRAALESERTQLQTYLNAQLPRVYETSTATLRAELGALLNDNGNGNVQALYEFGSAMRDLPNGNPATNLAVAIAIYDTLLENLGKSKLGRNWSVIADARALACERRARLGGGVADTVPLNRRPDEWEATEALPDRRLEQVQAELAELRARLDGLAAERPAAKTFNTAIFYDIENLTKGYNYGPELLDNLSLAEIYSAIAGSNHVGNIAVQRAYANWSDSRLRRLQSDIVNLGIDPIQIFGFGRGPSKNAADIQLAIDAMEIAATRPSIDVFAIVSGDGAFASLAKKLHEYGKIAIACSYETQKNRVLESVCDAFIPLEDPEEGVETLGLHGGASSAIDPAVLHTEDSYRELLMSGYKRFKLESPPHVRAIAQLLAAHSLQNEALEDAARRLLPSLDDAVGLQAVRMTMLAFLSADCFEIETRMGMPLTWVCSLREDVTSAADILDRLRAGVRSRLEEALLEYGETPDADLLVQLLP